MQRISIIRPDDWHIHLRDGEVLQHTVPAVANHFGRALIMPNLQPPLTTIRALIAYRERILQHVKPHANFTPYMSLYLNNTVKKQTLMELTDYPFILGAKLYPAGSTTNSAAGAKSVQELYPLFEVMQRQNLVLQIHGELGIGDIFEREARFIDETLTDIVKNFPSLRIVLEHISTRVAVEFIQSTQDTVAATITAHHLHYNRNDLLANGLRPHYYCLPILKHPNDQLALQMAAISGSSKFFAGTDSAPHAINNKESDCGCAGIYSSPYAIAIYATVFENQASIDKLEGFISCFGAEFYQLPLNQTTIELVQKPQTIPALLPLGASSVVPIAASNNLAWSINDPA